MSPPAGKLAPTARFVVPANPEIVWFPLAITNVTNRVPVPPLLVAESVKLPEPAAVGVPARIPVVELSVRPTGSEPAETAKLSGEFVALIVRVCATPTWPARLKDAITGAAFSVAKDCWAP